MRELTNDYVRWRLSRDLMIAAERLSTDHGRLCHHGGKWLVLTRPGHNVDDFVAVISPRTGREGVLMLTEPIERFPAAELWTWQLTVVVRQPMAPESRELAQARWEEHLAGVWADAPVVSIGEPKTKRKRRKLGPAIGVSAVFEGSVV